MEWLVVFVYTQALLVICLFSIEQLYLAWLYQKSPKRADFKPISFYPKVTVQLPIYNERYVVERLLDSVCMLNYPIDQLQIQVLDDSTDDTREIIKKKVQDWQNRGINIVQLSRPNREGFKAGALQYGLEQAKGEFIAIFDADFLPDPDFLMKTLPAFTENTGMVQVRWGHINQEYSLLTRLQAFALNAHFTVEQSGRNRSGKFMNFNGTGGVWRKSCILSAGGWHHDTLTEDLDLSYRAQLLGWDFQYLEHVIAPAELPVLVPAIKSQQYRWNKGAAETARKNLRNILAANLSSGIKFHAIMHLLNSSVFLFLFIAAVFSIPVLYFQTSTAPIGLIAEVARFFFIGFIAIMIFYWVSAKAANPGFPLRYYLIHLPLFLIFSMGLSLHNAIAVAEGYLGIRTPFIRTPKFNIRSKTDSWKGNSYLKRGISLVTWIEGGLALYFIFGMFAGVQLESYGLMLFHFMLAVGFGSVFLLSLVPVENAQAG